MFLTRPLRRDYSTWGPWFPGTYTGLLHRGGTVPVELTGPAGRVTQPGSDLPYTGMDPSDPATWTRQYNPQPGMIALLNFDGAVPNRTQTTGLARPPKGRRG
jgi:hypothetical protein